MDRFWRYKIDHIIFWVATVGFHMYTRAHLIEDAGFDQFMLEVVVRNGLLAALVYFNLLILIPRFAQRQRIVTYMILLAVGLGIYVMFKNAHDVYLNGYVLNDNTRKSFFDNSYYNLSIAIFYLAFNIALYLSKSWYFQRELIRKMEIEKLSTELEYLKAQINPHFVFNSINTIYFQIDKHNALARESLSAFSDMLRYQLYECNGQEIVIEKELHYLRNYVELQRMRKDENYNIAFVEEGDIRGFTISPLLLIPFVENAFKHVSHHPDKNEIRIEIKKDQHHFHFTVFNTKESKAVHNGFAGIGLKNVQRRLQLLYRDRHELKIDDRGESFEVKLSLKVY
jgi:two-component system LytT family sensor kinase